MGKPRQIYPPFIRGLALGILLTPNYDQDFVRVLLRSPSSRYGTKVCETNIMSTSYGLECSKEMVERAYPVLFPDPAGVAYVFAFFLSISPSGG